MADYSAHFEQLNTRVKKSLDHAWKIFGRVVARQSLVKPPVTWMICGVGMSSLFPPKRLTRRHSTRSARAKARSPRPSPRIGWFHRCRRPGLVQKIASRPPSHVRRPPRPPEGRPRSKGRRTEVHRRSRHRDLDFGRMEKAETTWPVIPSPPARQPPQPPTSLPAAQRGPPSLVQAPKPPVAQRPRPLPVKAPAPPVAQRPTPRSWRHPRCRWRSAPSPSWQCRHPRRRRNPSSHRHSC